jgi:phosphoribosylamine-glycine ligase
MHDVGVPTAGHVVFRSREEGAEHLACASYPAVLKADVLAAGTAEREGQVVTAGGRVLNVTGMGATPAEARERAYEAAERIHFDGRQLRTDIAARAVDRVEALR